MLLHLRSNFLVAELHGYRTHQILGRKHQLPQIRNIQLSNTRIFLPPKTPKKPKSRSNSASVYYTTVPGKITELTRESTTESHPTPKERKSTPIKSEAGVTRNEGLILSYWHILACNSSRLLSLSILFNYAFPIPVAICSLILSVLYK